MYRFIKNVINNIGVGTSNDAFVSPRPVAVDSIYGRAYNVRKQYSNQAGGAMLINKRVVVVGLTGNGAKLNGTVLLTPLAEREAP